MHVEKSLSVTHGLLQIRFLSTWSNLQLFDLIMPQFI